MKLRKQFIWKQKCKKNTVHAGKHMLGWWDNSSTSYCCLWVNKQEPTEHRLHIYRCALHVCTCIRNIISHSNVFILVRVHSCILRTVYFTCGVFWGFCLARWKQHLNSASLIFSAGYCKSRKSSFCMTTSSCMQAIKSYKNKYMNKKKCPVLIVTHRQTWSHTTEVHIQYCI